MDSASAPVRQSRARRPPTLKSTPDRHVIEEIRDFLLGDDAVVETARTIQAKLDDHRGPKSQLTVLAYTFVCCVAARVYPADDMSLSFIHAVMGKLPRDVMHELCDGRLRKAPTYKMLWYFKTRFENVGCVDGLGESFHDWSNMVSPERNQSLRAVQHACDRLIRATVPEEYLARTTTRLGDSMSHEASTRIRYKADNTIADVDVDLLDITETDEDDEKTRKKKRAKKDDFYTCDAEAAWVHMPAKNGRHSYETLGYSIHTQTLGPERGKRDVPDLVTQLTVRPGGLGYAEAALALAQTEKKAHPQRFDELLLDMGFTRAVPETLAIPLHQEGIGLVYDLPSPGKGKSPKRKNVKGAVLLDNDLFCPGANVPDLPRIPKSATPERRAELNKMHDDRAKHRFSVRAWNVDAEGSCRVECPARAGKVRCTLVAESMRENPDKPEILYPPETPGLACTQATITMPVSFSARRQQHAYGTTLHSDSVKRRSGVERNNSYNRSIHSKLQRHTVRAKGTASLLWFTAIKVAMVNLEAIDAWEHHH